MKNEAHILAQGLGQIPSWVDEILPVHGDSADPTEAMARLCEPKIQPVAQSGPDNGTALTEADIARASALLPNGWQVERVLPSSSDTTVLLSREGVLRISRTASGRYALRRERDLLAKLSADAQLGVWGSLVPKVIRADPDGAHLLTSRVPGTAVDQVTPVQSTNALAAIGRLHDRTSHLAILNRRWLDRVVDPPAEVVRAQLRGSTQVRSLDALVRDLRSTLGARCERIGWIHGDFHPGNVLYDGELVTGIVDWDQADNTGLVALDNSFWVLTSSPEDIELGARVVLRLRGDRPWTAAEAPVLGGPDPAYGRALLLLVWLRHVAGKLGKSEQYGSSLLWLRRNVVPVLLEVG